MDIKLPLSFFVFLGVCLLCVASRPREALCRSSETDETIASVPYYAILSDFAPGPDPTTLPDYVLRSLIFAFWVPATPMVSPNQRDDLRQALGSVDPIAGAPCCAVLRDFAPGPGPTNSKSTF